MHEARAAERLTPEEDLCNLDEPDALQQHQLSAQHCQHHTPREPACEHVLKACSRSTQLSAHVGHNDNIF